MSIMDELYQEMVLDHNKSPRNFGAMAEQTHTAEGFNPLCGDHYHVHARVAETGVIEDVRFEGTGCAISKAAASMMTEAIKGKSAKEAHALFSRFHDLVIGKLTPEEARNELGKLAVFAGISKFPSRVKCAVLCWHTLEGALKKTDDPITTE